MIDIDKERLLSFRDAAKQCPGGEVHYETIRRWADQGLKGKRLDSIKRGGKRYTSQPAMKRFFEALNEPQPTYMTAKDLAIQAELDRINFIRNHGDYE